MTRESAARGLRAAVDDPGGIGGTLAGNVLSMAAARATLEQVLTEEAYARMIPLAVRFAAGVDKVIGDLRLPWHIVRPGARAEYGFSAVPHRNWGESAAAEGH